MTKWQGRRHVRTEQSRTGDTMAVQETIRTEQSRTGDTLGQNRAGHETL